jgi:hypothetical protein
MLTLPAELLALLGAFAPLCSKRLSGIFGAITQSFGLFLPIRLTKGLKAEFPGGLNFRATVL